jgi:hypothetical protein
VEPYCSPALNTIDFILLLISHGLRHGLFRDGETLQEVLSAASQRGDRRIHWKNPRLPLIPKMKTTSGTFVDIQQPGTTDQARRTFSQMGHLAGVVPRILTHDIRRGGAKDLARLDQDIMKVVTPGTMRGLGHRSNLTAQRYNGQEDEPLNIAKAAIPEGRIDRQIQRAARLYVKLSVSELNLLVDKDIQEHPEVLQKSSRDVSFFIGPRAEETKVKVTFRDFLNLRARVARTVNDDHRRQWDEAQESDEVPRLFRQVPFPTIGQPSNFQSHSDVQSQYHTVLTTPCGILPRTLKSIPRDMLQRLKDRKKPNSGQFDEDTWRYIFGLLSPEISHIPSPCK